MSEILVEHISKSLSISKKQVSAAVTAIFNAFNLATGAYFYKLEIKGENNFVEVRKMILVK